MSRIKPHPALPENRVDLPETPASSIARKMRGSSELWHCPIARLPENRVDFPDAHSNFNDLQIVANAKKPRGPEEIRKRTRKLHEHGTTASACCFVSSTETPPTVTTAGGQPPTNRQHRREPHPHQSHNEEHEHEQY
jgi:hypothetical protein